MRWFQIMCLSNWNDIMKCKLYALWKSVLLKVTAWVPPNWRESDPLLSRYDLKLNCIQPFWSTKETTSQQKVTHTHQVNNFQKLVWARVGLAKLTKYMLLWNEFTFPWVPVHCLLISDADCFSRERSAICVAANGHCCIMCDFLIHQSGCIPRHLYTNRYVIGMLSLRWEPKGVYLYWVLVLAEGVDSAGRYRLVRIVGSLVTLSEINGWRTWSNTNV